MSRPRSNHSPERRVDHRIRADQVRVIADNGDNLGIMDLRAVIDRASGDGLHLVEIAPNAEPPVCRICDPGKLAYEEAREARQRKREGRGAKETKSHTIKLRPQTAEGDLRTKLKRVQDFLSDGDVVSIVVMLRGRQVSRDGDADAVIERIRTEIGDTAEIDGPKRSGRDIRLTVKPLAGKAG